LSSEAVMSGSGRGGDGLPQDYLEVRRRRVLFRCWPTSRTASPELHDILIGTRGKMTRKSSAGGIAQRFKLFQPLLRLPKPVKRIKSFRICRWDPAKGANPAQASPVFAAVGCKATSHR
jgi:hypothetical protein